MMDVFEIGKTIIVFILIPAVVWLYRRLDVKLEELDKRQSVQEARHGILDERVTNMKQDLQEIKDMLRLLLNK